MKIDFGQPLKTYAGGPIFTDVSADRTPVTLGLASVEALLTPLDGDRAVTASQHLERHELARAIHAAGEVDVSIDHLKLLKDRIALRWGTIIAAPAILALEGD